MGVPLVPQPPTDMGKQVASVASAMTAAVSDVLICPYCSREFGDKHK